MKKTDDTSSNKDDEKLNDISKDNNQGDVMKSQASLKINDDLKVEGQVSKLSPERRSVNSERRISDGFEYVGPARRMNIDRRQ